MFLVLGIVLGPLSDNDIFTRFDQNVQYTDQLVLTYYLRHLFNKSSFRQRDLATCVLGIRSYIQQEYSFMENPECLLITWYLVHNTYVLGIRY